MGSVPVTQPIVHFENVSRIERSRVGLEAMLEILRMDAFGPAVAELRFQGTTGELEPSFVEKIAELVRTGHPDHHGRSVGGEAKAVFAFAQRLSRTPAFLHYRRQKQKRDRHEDQEYLQRQHVLHREQVSERTVSVSRA